MHLTSRMALCYIVVLLLVAAGERIALTSAFTPDNRARTTSGTKSPTSYSSLSAKRSNRPYHSEDNGGNGMSRQREERPKYHTTTTPERPTETIPEQPQAEIIPSKPKIVVLGATGKVGRWVVRQLLESSELQQATVVAFCRDYDKACSVLYDDLVVANSQRRGPKLQIVQGDLLSKGQVYNNGNKGDNQLDEDDIDEQEWLQRAQSAAAFYGTSVSHYDDGEDAIQSGYQDNDNDEALREAISGCTAIISCVGSVRKTNVWTDFVVRPFVRLFKKDVSTWCPDAHHPFYTSYSTTKKAVEYAQAEQARRQILYELEKTDDESQGKKESEEKSGPPRIRFIRISDHCVSKKPWNLESLCANTFHSMAMRYQSMAEQVLEESTLLDTVVIQPGDMVEDERPDDVTLQVETSSGIPSPSRVGREDVAALVVASALLPSHHYVPKPKSDKPADTAGMGMRRPVLKRRPGTSPLLDPASCPPFHCKVATRWVGDAKAMQPFPAQGSAKDGHTSAARGLRKALQKDKRRRQQHTAQDTDKDTMVHIKPQKASPGRFKWIWGWKRQNLKPYGICVAIPVYAFMVFAVTTLFQNLMTSTSTSQHLAQILPTWFVAGCSSSVAFLWSNIVRYLPASLKSRVYSGAKFITI